MALASASDFLAQIAAWHDFYTLAGTIAATLLGLLFVAMSLRADPTGREFEFERRVWAAGAGALAMFADIVLIALVFMVPDQTALGLGLPVVILGALVLLVDLVAALHIRIVVSSGRWLPAMPIVGCLLQEMAGVGIMIGQSDWLDILAMAIGLLLISALIASWLLLSEPTLAALRPSGSRIGRSRSHDSLQSPRLRRQRPTPR